MTTAHSSFLDYVLPHVPGCTNEMALLEIKNTIIDFCEKSLILQRNHDPVTVIKDTIDYDFEPPTGYLVTKLMKAWYKGTVLEATAPDELPASQIYNANYPDVVKTSSDPKIISQKDERTFLIFPFPKETSPLSLTMRVALKPTRSLTVIEDVIFEDYAEVIGNGAKYRLMSSINKPYYSVAASSLANALYERGVNTARQRATRGYVRSDLRIELLKV
jgi:hypothetical protein